MKTTRLFDACDEMGICVWFDFKFALRRYIRHLMTNSWKTCGSKRGIICNGCGIIRVSPSGAATMKSVLSWWERADVGTESDEHG